MEPITIQEQRKQKLFIPDEKLALIFIQSDYSALYSKDKQGVVKQAYSNLIEVKNDEQEAKIGASFLGITNFGPDDSFILNKDVENGTITS